MTTGRTATVRERVCLCSLIVAARNPTFADSGFAMIRTFTGLPTSTRGEKRAILLFPREKSRMSPFVRRGS
jgi:hypothetical protein